MAAIVVGRQSVAIGEDDDTVDYGSGSLMELRKRKQGSSVVQQGSGCSKGERGGGSKTCVAIAGSDYCVIAADTRLSVGYSIYTRDYSKICKLYGGIPCVTFCCCSTRPGI
ncbi:hypothetical protein B296_00023725 [Ensete ventricosum]|uniref:Proteasome endopeptidase complex n=1 Tax=Ensete ventricosum TaxID=4639 RepID=A0A426Z740_ENSVE|nr:hypothetical protein B296_00023725 [Ensete ventricosum]